MNASRPQDTSVGANTALFAFDALATLECRASVVR
jgi:hypothetical protein